MIYFIWDSGSNAVKIGYSDCMDARLRDLQIGNPNALFLLGTCSGDMDREKAIHAKFADHRISGEWFRVSPKLTWFIRKATLGLARIVSNRGTVRDSRVAAWLEGRFRERREWASEELNRLAREAGISRNALYSAEIHKLPIRKTCRMGPNGDRFWVWIAGPDWPA